jgi:hypothetical protein
MHRGEDVLWSSALIIVDGKIPDRVAQTQP